MSELKKVRFGEIPIQIIDGDRGKNYPNGTDFSSTGYCLFLNAKNVTKEGFTFENNVFITKEKDSILHNGKLRLGDIVLTTRGTVGNVGIYKPTVPYKNIRINSGMVIIRSDSSRIDNTFLYLLLKSSNIQNKISAIKTGSAQPQLPISTLRNIELYIPPLDKQKKITAILSSLDDKLELNKCMNRNLEQQAQAVFREWFVNNPEKAIKEGKLSDICDYSKESITVEILNPDTYISTENLLQNKGGLQMAASLPAVEKTTKFNAGDVVISNIRPYFKKIYYCTFSGGCSTDVLCFVPKNPRYSIYMYQVLFDDAFFDYVVSGSKGTKMPRGDKKQIMNYQIALPSEELLRKYTKIVKPMVEQVTKNNEENKRLAESRDTLLPELMNGNILDKYYSCI